MNALLPCVRTLDIVGISVEGVDQAGMLLRSDVALQFQGGCQLTALLREVDGQHLPLLDDLGPRRGFRVGNFHALVDILLPDGIFCRLG